LFGAFVPLFLGDVGQHGNQIVWNGNLHESIYESHPYIKAALYRIGTCVRFHSIY
jgi:hypothetical protein